MSAKKKWLLTFRSFFLALIVNIFLFEVYFHEQYFNGLNIQFDPELGWVPIPNSTLFLKGKKYSTNSLGFRSTEVDPDKDHIIVVGDSVAWGYGVDDAETVSSHLERLFEGDQVLNLGVEGYGWGQSYLYLEKFIDQLNPKLIVMIVFSANDHLDTSTDTRGGKSKPLFVPNAEKIKRESWDVSKSYPTTINPNQLVLTNTPIKRYSCANMFSESWTLRQNLFGELGNILCEKKILVGWEYEYVFPALALKFGELANRHRSGLLFVLSPTLGDLQFTDEETFQRMESDYALRTPGFFNKYSLLFFQRMFGQIKLPYLDFFDTIKNSDWDKDALFLDNFHYTDFGNRTLAQMIFETNRLKTDSMNR